MQTRCITPDGFIFKTLIDACVIAKDAERAERVLEQMRHAMHTGKIACNKKHPNRDCVQSSMRGVVQMWLRAGKPAKAEKWLSAAVADGVHIQESLVRQVFDARTAEEGTKRKPFSNSRSQR